MAKIVKTKERKLEIIQHKIDKYNEKYNTFINYGISLKKINKVDMLKDQFIASKVVVEAS